MPTESSVLEEVADAGDLLEAYDRIRRSALALGEQRIYASAKAIMFARALCYMFLRPKRTRLEVTIFLPSRIRHPWVKEVKASSKTRLAHVFHVDHRDAVEEPLTEWMAQAFEAAGR